MTMQRSLDRLATARMGTTQLRRAAVEVLRQALPVDGWSWATADPTTGVAVSALAEHPLDAEIPELLAVEDDEAELNTRLGLASSAMPASALSAATGGDLYRSVRWREYLAPHDIGDELRIVFADSGGCWGYLDLYTSGHTRYNEEHVRLGLIAARSLTDPLRHSADIADSDAHASRSTEDSYAGLATAEPGVIVLDDRLEPLGMTGPATAWLSSLPGHAPDALPCSVLATATRARNSTETISGRLRNLDGLWTTVRAAPLDTGGMAVTIGQSAPHEVLDILARIARLSKREWEVVLLLYRGYDTHSIAHRLYISESTVQDHIKKILAKSGKSSRRTLLASAYPRLNTHE